MNLNELIQTLEKLKAKHVGLLPVFRYQPDSTPKLTKVVHCEAHKETEQQFGYKQIIEIQ